MPVKKLDNYQIGGVDSRSNPANFPPERLLRCRNFTPLVGGQLRLRYGYSQPAQSNTTIHDAIHSAVYYEQWSGSQSIVFGVDDEIYTLAIGSGAITHIAGPGDNGPWGHFRSNDRIFIGTANGISPFFVSYDGTTVRNVGLPSSPNITSGYALAATNGTAGSFATSLSSLATPGYEVFGVYYNPNTGHVGNRFQLGTRVAVNTTGYSLVLTGLSGLWSGAQAEWVVGLGRTNDGGQVPYWLTPTSGGGARLVVPNGATQATITDPTIDTTQELPYRNGPPPSKLNAFANVSGKIFGIRPGDINIYYTEDASEVNNGQFVGVPCESWSGDDLEGYPTAEVPTAIHGYQFELWAFSKNYLAIWSLFMFQQGQNPWRGPWNTGCAGQRAYVETPYGPHWITYDKRLMGWTGSSPIPVAEEYEAALLGKIGDQYIQNTELAYYADGELEIDRLYIKAQDVNGNYFVVIHDFKARDMRNQVAMGYEAIYQGMNPNTFVGSGYTPRQNVRDTNDRERLWVGSQNSSLVSTFYQLEDGSTSDNGTSYTGDAIALISAGDGKPLVDAIEWQGDGNVSMSYSVKNSLTLADFTTPATEQVEEDNPDNRYQVMVGLEATWVYARAQLTSHPADGDFSLSDPPHVPMETYGLMNYIRLKLGRQRPESA